MILFSSTDVDLILGKDQSHITNLLIDGITLLDSEDRHVASPIYKNGVAKP